MNIFLADDDRIIRMGLRKILSRESEEYAVIGEAANGEDALEQMRLCMPDLLITDIKMPIMDGTELIRKIREYRWPVRTIVLSGFDEYNFVRGTLKNGATDYLLKPINRTELLDLVEAICMDLKAIEGVSQQAVLPSQADDQDLNGIIGTCKQYIQKHYAEKITLASMAAYSNFSECYFSSLFKKLTGQNFNDYLCEVRIKKAMELLTAFPRDKIYEVSMKVGYSEVVTFNRNFKKVTGITPREFCKLMDR